MTGSVFFTTKTNDFCLTRISYSTLLKFSKTIHFFSTQKRSPNSGFRHKQKPKFRIQAEVTARRINLHSWLYLVAVNNTLTMQWLLFYFQLCHFNKNALS